ncbi:hypothetical protein [Actinacidiphila glaucinigra]|uniref:hypothetical protein n=1 Tax=Actinacidiphila glaucinigra TaxID=235986 RepID=UPI003D8A95E6
MTMRPVSSPATSSLALRAKAHFGNGRPRRTGLAPENPITFEQVESALHSVSITLGPNASYSPEETESSSPAAGTPP